MRRHGLSEEQWEKIKEMLPGREGSVGVRAKDNRQFVEAVIYKYRTGVAWRDLPKRFGDFRVIPTRHMRWARSGVWEKVLRRLSKDADNEYEMIDTTIVRAHQHSAGAKHSSVRQEDIGRGRLSTKIHALVDALGNPKVFF